MLEQAALPDEIVVTERPGAIHYRLPPHELGSFRWVGLLIMAFGLAPIGMAAGFGGFTLRMANHDPTALVSLLSLPVLIVFVGIGGLFVFVGGWILAGRSEIELSREKIRAIMAVGPFYLSRRRPRTLVRQFTVIRPAADPVQIGAVALQTAWPKLQVECAGSKPLTLAVGYPENLLRALAQALSQLTPPPPGELPQGSPVEPIAVIEETDDPAVAQERPRQPVDSQARLESYSDGVTITIPATGMWHGSNRFLVIWTWCWCLMLVPITVGFVAAALTGNVKNEAGQPVNPFWPGLFLVPFWLIGLGCMVGVLHRGRRQAVLAVAGGRLMILQTGSFHRQRQEWSREQLRSVGVLVTKHTDSEGGTQFKNELLIEPANGPSVKLLGHRSKQELEWIATSLRRALAMAATPADRAISASEND
jgi:hypothetical protein